MSNEDNINKCQIRIDGPTPNGGAYSIAYYYDKNGNPCDVSTGILGQIVEYDKNGKSINVIISAKRPIPKPFNSSKDSL